MSTMLTFLTIAGGLVAYLFIGCLITATMLKFGPDAARKDETMCWVIGMLFPIALPYMGAIYAVCGLVGVLQLGVKPIMNLMVKAVEWMTTERQKKSNLPKAEVRK